MARVLVVDEERAIRSSLADALAASGHDVEQAESGEQAEARLLTDSFHVLVTDLMKPQRGGMDLVRRARAERPDVEVIVLTAHASVAGAVEAMKLGALDYLEKPLSSPDALRLLIERAASRRQRREAAPSASADDGRIPSHNAPTMAEAERDAIQRALLLFGGNRRQAALYLGIGLRTLYDKLRKYDLR